MIIIQKYPTRSGSQTTISTENHWPSDGIIRITDDERGVRIGYSSGGVKDNVSAVELAQSMVEAWTEALEIAKAKSAKT